MEDKIYTMKFFKVYPLLVQKAERKIIEKILRKA